MNQSLDGDVDHTAFAPSRAVQRRKLRKTGSKHVQRPEIGNREPDAPYNGEERENAGKPRRVTRKNGKRGTSAPWNPEKSKSAAEARRQRKTISKKAGAAR